jgi:hypothetical protein
MRSSSNRKWLALVGAVVLAGSVAAVGAASRTATDPPRNISPPTLTALQVGQTLSADVGKWSGTAPFTFYYQWTRSDGGDGTPIAGAGGPTYTPTEADIGHSIFVQVKAENAAGPGWANSPYTSAVTGATAADAVTLPDGRTSVLVDHVSLPDRLVIPSAEFTPTKLTSSGTVTARVTVVDRQQHPVRGVLVQVVALPFGSIKPVAEATTDTTGVATIALTGTAQIAQTPGGAIALSIRARKPGDDVLTGVTATRWVKLDVSH